jgi:hypothetical protein
MMTKRLGACTVCGLKATVKPNGTAYCARCRRYTPRFLDPIPWTPPRHTCHFPGSDPTLCQACKGA